MPIQASYTIGVDIGGTHISSALVDSDQKQIVEDTYASSYVVNTGSTDSILQTWADCLNKTIDASKGVPLSGIAFAMPGPFDYAAGVAKYPEGFKYGTLNGIEIKKRLNPFLHKKEDFPMRFLNDATSFAVGEAWLSENEGYEKQLCITLGTGLGAGFIDNGIPVISDDTVPPNGCLWNIPYKDGIADDYFSTRGCINAYEQATGKTVKGVKELAEQFNDNSKAREVLEAFGQDLGGFLAPWLKTFRADVLVLGGNISKAYFCFGNALKSSLCSKGVSLPIRISLHMERGAIIGCTRLFESFFWKKIRDNLPHL